MEVNEGARLKSGLFYFAPRPPEQEGIGFIAVRFGAGAGERNHNAAIAGAEIRGFLAGLDPGHRDYFFNLRATHRHKSSPAGEVPEDQDAQNSEGEHEKQIEHEIIIQGSKGVCYNISMASKGIVYVNGKFYPADKAALPVSDLTIQRGYGVNEVFRTYNQRPFLLAEHLRRLDRSMRLLMVKNPPSMRKIRKIIAAGLRKSHGDTLVKIIITGGPGKFITPVGQPGLLVYFLPFSGHPEADYKRGFRMMTTKALRTLPEAKSIDYLMAVVGQIEAARRGFDEVIFTDGGRLLEGATFNIGVIRGRVLIVPKRGVLKGITMLVTLHIAHRAGLRVHRRDITFTDLKRADEMISTSTIREVLPVVRVDNIVIGSGKPGKYARMLLEEFREYAKRHKDKE